MTDKSQLVRNLDIIITATISVSTVLPDDRDLYKNKLVVGERSCKNNMRELPQTLFEQADYYYIDSEQGKIECGDIINPMEKGRVKDYQVTLLPDLLSRKTKVLRNVGFIIFKTLYMISLNASIGNYVYKKAKNLGIDQEVNI